MVWVSVAPKSVSLISAKRSVVDHTATRHRMKTDKVFIGIVWFLILFFCFYKLIN